MAAFLLFYNYLIIKKPPTFMKGACGKFTIFCLLDYPFLSEFVLINR
jgi:hypothetical protein